MNIESGRNPLEVLNESGMGCAPLTVNTALQWSEWLLEELRQGVVEASGCGAGRETVWATQAFLAVRWGMKKTAVSRYIQAGVSAGKVRAVRPDDGVKQGVTRYSVEDFDAFMISGGDKNITGKTVWK